MPWNKAFGGSAVVTAAEGAFADVPVPSGAPNGPSIAILLEHLGASVLLGADAFPTVLVPALQALALQRRAAAGLRVGAFKLSHHGSRANVNTDLLKAVQADHYIFSTNNAIFRHPDDEAVARVLTHGGKQPTLWFNYGTERNRRWAAEELQSQHGYQAQYPAGDTGGVVLTLHSPGGAPPRPSASTA